MVKLCDESRFDSASQPQSSLSARLTMKRDNAKITKTIVPLDAKYFAKCFADVKGMKVLSK